MSVRLTIEWTFILIVISNVNSAEQITLFTYDRYNLYRLMMAIHSYFYIRYFFKTRYLTDFCITFYYKSYSSNSPYCLSRQRSTELQSNMSTPRTSSQMRPHTASGAIAMSTKQPSNMMDASTQAQSNHGTLKARQRMFAPNGLGICSDAGNGNMEYSSSSSEQLMQQQQELHQQHHKPNTNYSYIQQQQQSQPQVANNNSNNYELNALNLKNNNCNSVGVGLTPTTSQHSLQSNNSNASSVKMSKFCHECGAKFVLEHAKFCMDCGVRRVVL